MKKEDFEKRYWVFYSPQYECGLGMHDFDASFQTKVAAEKRLRECFEWGALFDSHTGKQYDYYSEDNKGNGVSQL